MFELFLLKYFPKHECRVLGFIKKILFFNKFYILHKSFNILTLHPNLTTFIARKYASRTGYLKKIRLVQAKRRHAVYIKKKSKCVNLLDKIAQIDFFSPVY